MSWADLGEHVRRARAESGQTQAAFGRRVGLSARTVRSIEAGDERQRDPVTVDRVELALGWAPGSVERVVQGGQPFREVDELLARVHAAWLHLPVEARRMVVALMEFAVDDRLSPGVTNYRREQR